MRTDLGTYHVHVEFTDGRGFIMEWKTGARYCGGRASIHPLDAARIQPSEENERELFAGIRYMFTDGNYGCDCNRGGFLAHAAQSDDPDLPCGETLVLKRLDVERPDGTFVDLLERKRA